MPAPEPNRFDFDTALFLAMRVHARQLDKAGEPYILHPIRVALRLETPFLRVLGVLHDVLEDSEELARSLVRSEIVGYFGNSLASLVERLSRGDEGYERYIESLVDMPILRKVKLADLADNLDEQRWARTGYMPSQKKRQQYIWARWYLQRANISEEKSPLSLCKTASPQDAEKIERFGIDIR